MENTKVKAGDKQAKKCDCYDPLVYDCSACKDFPGCKTYLGWYSAIPHFILDGHLMQVSPSAVKVFLFLNRRAGFATGGNHFGRCWATYQQIEDATGVKQSNMSKYLKELVDHNLIAYKWTKVNSGLGVKTIHEFTVTHYGILHKLGIKRTNK